MGVDLRVGDCEIVYWNVADFEHLLDGGDAGDGFLCELTDAVRKRAGQLAVDVDGAAAHAFNDTGVLGFVTVKPSEDEVLSGAADAAQDAENFDLHGFRRGALKDGPGCSGQPGANLAEGKKAGIGWGTAGRLR